MSSNAVAPVVVAIVGAMKERHQGRLGLHRHDRHGGWPSAHDAEEIAFNDLLKPLAEMGLMVHEERVWRDHQAGLSTRVSGRVVDSVASSITPPSVPAPFATSPTPAAQPIADRPVVHWLVPAPAPRVDQGAALAVELAASPKAPPVLVAGSAMHRRPRIAGQGAQRLLAGDTGE